MNESAEFFVAERIVPTRHAGLLLLLFLLQLALLLQVVLGLLLLFLVTFIFASAFASHVTISFRV